MLKRTTQVRSQVILILKLSIAFWIFLKSRLILSQILFWIIGWTLKRKATRNYHGISCVIRSNNPLIKDLFIMKTLKWVVGSGVMKALQVAYNLPNSFWKIFTNSVKLAQICGKLLAHSLMLGFPFREKKVTLIGFSLGTQVVYSWLEELARFKWKNIGKRFIGYIDLYIVHKVNLFGGTLAIPNDTSSLQPALSWISTNLQNFYCSNDWFLKLLFQITTWSNPIGLGPILSDELKENNRFICQKIKDVDVTHLLSENDKEGEDISSRSNSTFLMYKSSLAQVLPKTAHN